MNNVLKQSGIALAVALIGSSFAMAQNAETGVVTPEVKEVAKEEVKAEIVKVEEFNNAPAAAADKASSVEKPKEVVKPKPKPRKVVPQEINMKSKGNFDNVFSNLSTNANQEIINGVEVDGVYVEPNLKIKDLDNPEEHRYPLDLTITFSFKDIDGVPIPEGALLKRDGKDITVYQVNSDLSYVNVQTLDSSSDEFKGKYKVRECQAIIYEYNIAGENERSVESFALNKRGKVTPTVHPKCKRDNTNNKETTVVDASGNFVNITWNKASTMVNKEQSFMVQAIKGGKEQSLENAVAYVFDSSLQGARTFKADTYKSGSAYFNDLKLPEGSYKIVVEYQVNGKKNTIINSRTVN